MAFLAIVCAQVRGDCGASRGIDIKDPGANRSCQRRDAFEIYTRRRDIYRECCGDGSLACWIHRSVLESAGRGQAALAIQPPGNEPSLVPVNAVPHAAAARFRLAGPTENYVTCESDTG
jgi:hypothetical protein